MKKNLTILLSVCLLVATNPKSYALNLIDSTLSTQGTFEANVAFWTIANAPAQTNRWWIGSIVTLPSYQGTRAAFVGTASTNNIYNATATSISYLYTQNLSAITAANNYITLNFHWKALGELGVDSFMAVIVPSTYTPVAGTPIPMANRLYTWVQPAFSSVWTLTKIVLPCSLANGSQYKLVFIWRNNNVTGINFAPNIDMVGMYANPSPACPAVSGIVTNLGVIPGGGYNSGAGSWTTTGDELTASNTAVCGNSAYFSGNDDVYTFSFATSGQTQITLTAAAASFTGMMLYDGCPNNTVCSGAGTCVGSIQDNTGSKSLCLTVSTGITYYLVLDKSGGGSFTYTQLQISAPAATLPGTVCSNPVVITTGAGYGPSSETTQCMGNEYNNSVAGTCFSIYESGEDKVYRYTTGATGECLNFTLSGVTNAATGLSTTLGGFQVYEGCPGVAGTTCVLSAGGTNPVNAQVTLPLPLTTYYFIVDSWAPPSAINYTITISNFGSGAPNDAACAATVMTVAGPLVSSSNSCSGGVGETAAPVGCSSAWSGGTLNTVWFTFQAISTSTKIQTSPGTLTDTQIEVFQGAACGSLTSIAGACNNNNTTGACSAVINYWSVVTVTTVIGQWYWVRVDGVNNSVGSFSISATDATSGAPVYSVQDCQGALPVCVTPYTSPTSYFGCGNFNELPLANTGCPTSNPYYNGCPSTVSCYPGTPCNFGCLLSNPPERNAVWLTWTTTAAGNLRWVLTAPGGGYYDWALFNITSPALCPTAGVPNPPVRCNWNAVSMGLVGMHNNEALVGGNSGNFQDEITLPAGTVYALCLSNWSGTSGGWTIDFTGSTCGFQGSTNFIWSGNVNTTWGVASNWVECGAPPICGNNATIVPATNQPVLVSPTSVKDLIINAGATLTINAGVTLTVCGNFTNNGTLIASPTSTILFNGTGTQTISGNLTGANAFGNLTVTKTAGTVVLNNDIDIAGNFTTSNATSIFNANSRYIKLKGNFSNSSGATTFTNVGTGTLEFNGAANQNYTAGGALTLNHVYMNQSPASSVTLIGNNMTLGTSGNLTLTNGKIITNAFEVTVNNTATTAVNAGDADSYVEGNLRRFFNGIIGSYEIPVGHSTKGYQRANLNFTTAPSSVPVNLLSRFDPYPSAILGPTGPDCPSGTGYLFDLIDVLDNGYWTITSSAQPFVGFYDMTLYNTNYTNLATLYTVIKSPTSAVPTQGSWTLDGTCVIGTPPNATQRTGMTGFSTFGVGRSDTPLPIELVNFSGHPEGILNVLDWTTHSELNNDYFIVEKSANGSVFEELTTVDGAGISVSVLNYTALDEYPFNGISFYRLKQVDFDGNYVYSPTISIDNHFDEILVANVHPNPTTSMVSFDFNTPNDGDLEVQWVDMYGRILHFELLSVKEGVNSIESDLSAFAPGIYSLTVSFRNSSYQYVEKIVKF